MVWVRKSTTWNPALFLAWKGSVDLYSDMSLPRCQPGSQKSGPELREALTKRTVWPSAVTLCLDGTMMTRISSPVDANGRDTGVKRQTQGPSAHQGHAWPLMNGHYLQRTCREGLFASVLKLSMVPGGGNCTSLLCYHAHYSNEEKKAQVMS